jgi:hypothetical protein
VTFSEVVGMTQLNNHSPIRVKNCKVGRGSRRCRSCWGGGGGSQPLTDGRQRPQQQRGRPNLWQLLLRPTPPLPAACCRADPAASLPRPRGCQAHSFELDIDTTKFGEYARGGIVTQYKPAKTMAFKSLEEVRGKGGGRRECGPITSSSRNGNGLTP